MPSRFGLALTLIVAGQAAWLGYFMHRGWFYGDDLPYLADATNSRLGWRYLSSPLNDHFIPGLRLACWLLNRTIGLDYGITIALRVLMQAVATVLLARLLVLLIGWRPAVPVIVGWYAFGPLLLPGSLWLVTALDLLPSQVFVLLAIDLHVRYTRSGRLPAAFGAAASLLLAVSFWELTGLDVLLLPILSLVFLHAGTFGQRLRAAVRRWPGWLILAAMLAGWLVAFLTGPYGGAADPPGFSTDLLELWTGWWFTTAPALIGGPWHWYATGNVYFSIVDPPLLLRLAGQAAFLAFLLLGLWRCGLRAIAAWLMPAVILVTSTVVIAAGRYRVFGDLTPRSLNYFLPLAVPIALAAALSLPAPPPSHALATEPFTAAPLPPSDAMAAEPSRSAPSHRRHGFGRRPRLAVNCLLCLAVLASSTVSAVNFADRWSQNPSRQYVRSLTATVRRAGPDVNLWDTRVPQSVLAAFSDHNHVSDVLRLAQVPAQFQQPESAPMLVTDQGTLVPARLYPFAHGAKPAKAVCTALIQGTGTWHIPLSDSLGVNEYFVQLSYLQHVPTTVYITVADKSGRSVAPVGGARRQLNHQLANLYLRLPPAAADMLVLRSESTGANVCIGAVTVGVPLAAGR